MSNLDFSTSSGGYRPGVLGGSQIGGSKCFQLFKYPRLPDATVGYHTKVVTFGGPRKYFLLAELCDFLENNHSF